MACINQTMPNPWNKTQRCWQQNYRKDVMICYSEKPLTSQWLQAVDHAACSFLVFWNVLWAGIMILHIGVALCALATPRNPAWGIYQVKQLLQSKRSPLHWLSAKASRISQKLCTFRNPCTATLPTLCINCSIAVSLINISSPPLAHNSTLSSSAF